MTTQTRLEALAQDIGADVKTLLARKSVSHQTFTAEGPVTVFTSNQRWYASAPSVVTQIRATLATAGTSTTQVRIRINGTWLETLNLASGVTTVVETPGLVLAEGDYILTDVTQAGTGAVSLAVQFRIEE